MGGVSRASAGRTRVRARGAWAQEQRHSRLTRGSPVVSLHRGLVRETFDLTQPALIQHDLREKDGTKPSMEAVYSEGTRKNFRPYPTHRNSVVFRTGPQLIRGLVEAMGLENSHQLPTVSTITTNTVASWAPPWRDTPVRSRPDDPVEYALRISSPRCCTEYKTDMVIFM